MKYNPEDPARVEFRYNQKRSDARLDKHSKRHWVFDIDSVLDRFERNSIVNKNQHLKTKYGS